MIADEDMKEGLSVVGKSHARIDAVEKATGEALYCADLDLRGALSGKLLRSQHLHAVIERIDKSEAEKVRGVRAVLTGWDIPGRNGFGAFVPDQPALCRDKVKCVGDGVALVAAETEEAAVKALNYIKIYYRPLPAVLTAEEALLPDAPKITKDGNIASSLRLRKGDAAAGFAKADIIVEKCYKLPYVDHAYLETDCALARPGPDGSIEILGPTQYPFGVRRNVAAVLGLPISKVRFIATTTGGGFGGRTDASIDICVRAALLAHRCKRPVFMQYSLEEVTAYSVKRHPMVIRYKSGATKDGHLTSAQVSIICEQGSYASVAPIIPPAGGFTPRPTTHAVGPYEVPDVEVETLVVYTNRPTSGAMRGLGVPQVNFACESQMDELAARLGMDPLEFRLKNCLKKGGVTATGQVLQESVGLREALEKAAAAAKWAEQWKAQGEMDCGQTPSTKLRGMGVAASFWAISTGTFSDGIGANITLKEDGSAILSIGIIDYGQGSKTALAQIAAEELGLNIGDVVLAPVDTNYCPESGPTVASRSTTLGGNAVIEASREAKSAVAELAADELDAPVEELVFKNRLIYTRANPAKALKIGDIIRKAMHKGKKLYGSGWCNPPAPSFDKSNCQGAPWHAYAFGAQIAEVEVDPETGQVRLIRLVAAHDVGKAVNPRMIDAQIHGGVLMGAGYGLMEEICADGGAVINRSLSDYLIPTSLDVPEITPMIVENPNPLGPYGAKGAGEPPTIPTASAIANAIYNATGVRLTALPARPEDILAALQPYPLIHTLFDEDIDKGRPAVG